MAKLNFDEALDAINNEKQVLRDDVAARALRRTVWTNSNGLGGCMPNSLGYNRTKADAIESCIDIAGDDAPRGFKRDLQRYESADAHGETYKKYLGTP